MLRNYLKIALRNLWKERFYSLISIGGLAAGISISVIIFQFVFHEWSYDSFHEKEESIYRIVSRNEQSSYPAFSSKLAEQLVRGNPEIKAYTRILRDKSAVIKSLENPTLINEETGFVFADQSLFSIFSFPLKYGNAKKCLERPFTVVISERVADKYFGKENPVGKTISYNGQHLLEVTGVANNVPTNSTLRFDFVSSQNTYQKINSFAFDNLPNFETFLLIDQKAAIPKIARNSKAANKLIGAVNYNDKDIYELEPLQELRFGNSYTYNEKTSVKLLYVLSGISVLILFLALFNYINLATARATLRAKEVGVRKAIGANRFSLVKQFFLESTLVNFFAFILSFCLVLLFREPFNNLFQLEIDLSFLSSQKFIGILISLFLTSTLIAGSYPALILSSFSPIKVLKGNYISKNQGRRVRNTMMVFQFSVSATLILCSLMMQRQIDYIKDRDLGFNRNQVVSIKLSSKVSSKSDNFKKDIKSQAGVEHVSLSNTPFFKSYMEGKFQTKTSSKLTPLTMLEADADFVSNLGLIWKEKPTENAVVNADGFYVTLNENAVRALGYTNGNVIGQSIFPKDGQEYGKIVGVVKDFSLSGPLTDSKPMLFLVKKNTLVADGFRNMQVRLGKQDHISDKLAILEKIYHTYDPETPFLYSFLDDEFQNTFIAETRVLYMVQLFTAVAISLACLGLFGLLAFVGHTRLKEVSIRKVMGASIANILSLLSRDFLVLMVIAVLIAVPGAYYLMHLWLQGFAYRVEIHWWIFIVGSVISLAVGIITVIYQGLKVALANPVNALRSE
ncbi:ABC transporter permease [Spirosoma sp. 48-14]|uniref:ABC transporter permease n=1 Tax=Spirosoma sp. 48-14 TaxID=1895854 RepID=UPI00095E4825|nr:ABC transporter permease [Spirosoma sp. 48-14]OJW74007.1 MAG: hypothetical protein BGO59_12765 [Spirosoma sp. 48-14]